MMKIINVLTKISSNPFRFTILSGGVGEINFGKQYRQGNRIYSCYKPAMCVVSQPVGNTGGNSYMYLERIDNESAQTDF